MKRIALKTSTASGSFYFGEDGQKGEVRSALNSAIASNHAFILMAEEPEYIRAFIPASGNWLELGESDMKGQDIPASKVKAAVKEWLSSVDTSDSSNYVEVGSPESIRKMLDELLG